MVALTKRRAARLAVLLTAALFALFGGLLLVNLFTSTPSAAVSQRLVSAQVTTGVLTAGAALTASILAVQQARRSRKTRRDIIRPHLRQQDHLVNRSAELLQLVGHIQNSQVSGIHGARGAGKSFLLEHLADVINGFRNATSTPKPSNVSVALYYDLADATGFAEFETQICRTVTGEPNGTWADFVSYLNREFKRERLLLILDNVNSPGIWRELGQAAYLYLAQRGGDRLVFGSIDPVVFSNLEISQMPMLGLDIVATGELVASRGLSISGDDLAELHTGCKGLPFYVRLFTTYGNEFQLGSAWASLDDQLIPDLDADTRRLMAYLALIALVNRRIPVSELSTYPIARLEHQLTIAENRTLITPMPDEGDRRFKIHDIVRDAVLRRAGAEVEEAAGLLFEQARKLGRLEHAAVFAMFTNPLKVGDTSLDEVLIPVLTEAISSRNYALLGTLYGRAQQRRQILEFVAQDPGRSDLFCYARGSELAGLGRYADAELTLLASTVVRLRWDRQPAATDLQANIRFLQADIAHLRNRYDEAAAMFKELGKWALITNRQGLYSRCVWGHGHVLRHQGRDLTRALDLFDQVVGLSESAELYARVHSITGATGIRVYECQVSDDEEQTLANIEDEVVASTMHDAYLLSIWKSQAQVAWLRGHAEMATDIIEAAIKRAIAHNDRLLYNLYFERAEFARLRGDVSTSLNDYRSVLEFGRGNKDRNLIANALLGLVLLDLSVHRWLHHGTVEDARASVISARDIATAADIAITAHIATLIASMLDEPDARPSSIRLIVF